MKKSVILLFLVIFLMQSVLAFKTLEVTSEPISNVLIGSNEASFLVKVSNNGNYKDTFRISTLDVGWDIKPTSVTVNGNSDQTFTLKLTPFNEKEPAKYGVSVRFTSFKDESVKESHLFEIRVLGYEDLIDPGVILPKELNANKENLVSVNLVNANNIKLEDIKVVLESDYFSYEKTLNFEPYEEKKEDFLVKFDSSIEEGMYPIRVQIYYKDKLAKEETSDMRVGYFTEVSEVNNPGSGFLIERESIVKSNDGLVVSNEKYEREFNWFQKLFTKTTPEPDSIIEENGRSTYVWEFDLQAGEERTIFIETNYRYLVLAIILVVLVLLWLYNITKKDISISKKVTTIKKSSEGFSTLNIQLHIKNNSKNVLYELKILDKVIGAHEEPSFGMIRPDSVKKELNSVKMVWNVPTLNKGEERIISYQVRLRLRVGMIPIATAKYRVGNQIKYVNSKPVRLF